MFDFEEQNFLAQLVFSIVKLICFCSKSCSRDLNLIGTELNRNSMNWRYTNFKLTIFFRDVFLEIKLIYVEKVSVDFLANQIY